MIWERSRGKVRLVVRQREEKGGERGIRERGDFKDRDRMLVLRPGWAMVGVRGEGVRGR